MIAGSGMWVVLTVVTIYSGNGATHSHRAVPQ